MFDGTYHEDGTVTAEVPSATYTVLTDLYDVALTRRARYTALSKVDLAVRRATTVGLDARKAVPMSVDAGDAQARVRFVSFHRSVRGGAGVTMGCICLNAEAFATPTPAPRYGSLSLQDTWTFADRISTLGVAALHDPFAVSAKFPGQRSVPVVWAGDGTDFTGIDVAGKVALVGLKVPENSADPVFDAYLAGRNATAKALAAGAAAIAAFVDVEGAVAQSNSSKEIPYLAVSRADGLALKATGSIAFQTKANPEFIYNLHYSTPNGIAANLSHRVDRSKLTRVRSEYHADIAGLSLWRAWVGFRKDAGGMMTMPAVYLKGPVALDEYVGGSPDAVENVNWTRIGVISDGNRNQITMYNRRPFTGKDIWFAGPSSPGGFDPNSRSFYRFNLPGGSQLLSPSHYMGDGSSGHLLDVDYFGYHATSYRLFREGTEIPGQYPGFSRFPYFAVPNEAATYRLDAVTVLPKSGLGGPTQAIRRLSHRVDTSWTFRSDRGNPLPCYEGSPFECKNESLLQPFYDLGLDPSNNAPAGRHTFGVEVLRTDTGAPAVLAGLSARYSTDEGLTWHQATVAGNRVTVDNPNAGFVWLQIEAWTANGDRVTQTVQRIYGIR
ncbi:MAG TPA: hypothetical protein DGT23_10450 [Micromonosporaceae bacterium]|nr:hypothetical protein [Micromonosporaceae bacterium]